MLCGPCGRWVSNFMLRRQALSCLDEVWRWIKARCRQAGRPGSLVFGRASSGGAPDVHDELPLAGGGHAEAHRRQADRHLRLGAGSRRLRGHTPQRGGRPGRAPVHERGATVVELFGGIGGLRMSVDRLGIHVCAGGYSESDKEARNVYRRDLAGDLTRLHKARGRHRGYRSMSRPALPSGEGIP